MHYSGKKRGEMITVETSSWSAAHIAKIPLASKPEAPAIGAMEATPLFPDQFLWDLWPIQYDDGSIAEVAEGTLWVILSAARSDNPDARHDVARMRLFHKVGDVWRDCGPLMPDGFTPGSREWSGSTRLDPETGKITLWFTAAGRREGGPRFEQRLFLANGQLDMSKDVPCISDWTNLCEAVHNDGTVYVDTAAAENIAGRIKGFRDPFWFRDPITRQGYILFTASQVTDAPTGDYDGVIGIARAQDPDGLVAFTALPALIDASGISNELELPHVVYHDARYYLFWCTQRGVFAPDVPAGPTGLYGMVAPSLFGPYEPLNGTGLVLANPASEPRQAYGWRVLPTLEVISFVDYWGVQGRDIDNDDSLRAAQFGGTIAPTIRIKIEGNMTWIATDKL